MKTVSIVQTGSNTESSNDETDGENIKNKRVTPKQRRQQRQKRGTTNR